MMVALGFRGNYNSGVVLVVALVQAPTPLPLVRVSTSRGFTTLCTLSSYRTRGLCVIPDEHSAITRVAMFHYCAGR